MSGELERDVHWLGEALGGVLRTQAGERLFETVEAMRRSAKRAREAPQESERAEARGELERHAGALGPGDAADVARAFTIYFQVVNLAEDVHRTRELRRRETDGGGMAEVDESLRAVLGALHARGVDRAGALSVLEGLELSFVFTAHPTEARRRTTERLLSGVRDVVVARDRTARTPSERAGAQDRLAAHLEALWQHATERPEPPGVMDEVKAGLWYFEHVLFDAVARLQRQLRAAFEDLYGPIDPLELPVPVRFGSWMGSDRDGNPYVTDGVTEQTLMRQRAMVLARYRRDLWGLIDLLAASTERLPADDELERVIAHAAAAVPELRDETERRDSNEPLRRLLTYAHERLARAENGREGGYPGPEAFFEDLEAARRVLARSGARALADGRLLDLMVRVRCFGFHLASLDVREDARVHRRVMGELVGREGYADLDVDARLALLEGLRLPTGPEAEALSDEARRLLSLLSSLAPLRRRFGARAIAAYAISRCESAADVFDVHRLLELHGLGGAMDVVPLLEARPTLENAGPVLERLLSDPGYRAHLERRGNLQELLVGYSDSMKEAGIVASRVAIRRAQRAAADACRAHGVTLRVFHGRGGSVSRGGGPTYRAVLALPRDAFSGRLKITEQGEVRSFHFGDPDLSVRYLEQTLGAATARSCEARGMAEQGDDADDTPDTDALLERMADACEQAYGALVDDPATMRFFSQATPFAQIADLNIGSRPTSREEGPPSLDALRAIPWVFAWSQCRLVLTGWYGAGAALARGVDERGAPALRALGARSRFLANLVDAVQMTLAKSDLPIAEHYATLCDDADVRERWVGTVEDEHARAKAQVLAVTGQDGLLSDDPVLRRSIRLRNPYVDPLSYLQVRALLELRRTESDDDVRERWARVAHLTVQGIAAGLRNTG